MYIPRHVEIAVRYPLSTDEFPERTEPSDVRSLFRIYIHTPLVVTRRFRTIVESISGHNARDIARLFSESFILSFSKENHFNFALRSKNMAGNYYVYGKLPRTVLLQ